MLNKIVLLLLLLGALHSPVIAARRIDMGERFPEIALPQPLQAQERSYLGLPPGETFTLSQIDGEVVLCEAALSTGYHGEIFPYEYSLCWRVRYAVDSMHQETPKGNGVEESGSA